MKEKRVSLVKSRGDFFVPQKFLQLRAYVHIKTLNPANFPESVNKFLYVLRISLCDYALKAGIMTQVYVSRADYHAA